MNSAANANNMAERDPAKDPPTRKLSDMLLQELEPMSPLQVDFPDTKFGSGNGLNTTEEQTTHTQPTTAGFGGSEPAVSPTEVKKRVDKSRTLVGTTDVRYQAQERGSWVNIKLVNPNMRNSADSAELLKPEERGRVVGRDPRKIDHSC